MFGMLTPIKPYRASTPLEKRFQINTLKTIRQLFIDCSTASLSLMETYDKELQKPLRLYRNKEILKNLSELA